MIHPWRSSLVRTTLVLTLVGPLVATAGPAQACTTAVISGKATPDGRPLLWKNRDAPHRDNEVIYLPGEPYRCVAVANAGRTKSIWMGVNEAGFCIENSLSKDLTEKGVKGQGNGAFMLRALQTCATVEDFERLLEETNKGGRATNANFGVIDAQGGAAIFESGATRFVKFDANDPEVAPDGYIVRANFSFTAQNVAIPVQEDAIRDLYSSGRFQRGCRLMDRGLAFDGLTPRYLLRHCCRDFAGADCEPIIGSVNGPSGDLPDFVDTNSTISRARTVSAAVFQGVRPGEDPLLSTMWVFNGDPAFSVAVPCWVAAEGVAAELDGPETSDLCTASLALRDSQYSEGTLLRTENLPEIWETTWQTEDAVFDEVNQKLAIWRNEGITQQAALKVHQRLARRAYDTLTELTESVTEREEVAPVAVSP